MHTYTTHKYTQTTCSLSCVHVTIPLRAPLFRSKKLGQAILLFNAQRKSTETMSPWDDLLEESINLQPKTTKL